MADQQPQQQIQIRLDESKMVVTYANTIRTTTTTDEIIMDFGLNMPVQQSPNEPVGMHFGVGSRVVMNWTGAKRLMLSLQQAVAAYEQNFGVIELAPQQQRRSS
ncbi:MAG: DUF3467 domain-containing protein [Planctomycetota bacterium]|nr:DUF3467 domain-containing protein [Planctomycetota bacterium]